MDGKDKREPKRRNAAKTRAKIIAAAEDAFGSMGYAKASVREIARAAEVAPSLVLRYFESKSDLFEKCLLNAIFSGNPTGNRDFNSGTVKPRPFGYCSVANTGTPRTLHASIKNAMLRTTSFAPTIFGTSFS